MFSPSPLTNLAAPASALAFPDVWRASELAVSHASTRTSGYASLDNELPNRGWPRSSLIELLLRQGGIGEMQLLKPVLASLSKRHFIALVQPPWIPHAMACQSWGIEPRRLLWIRPECSADALWTTEQILKSGGCGAVILWQSQVRTESLRRLNLAVQGTDTCFWFVRPLACASDASPAPLRLALRPAAGGVAVEIVKRRGPGRDTPIWISLADQPVSRFIEGTHDVADIALPLPAADPARNPATTLV